jgi:hypothetical protein
MPLRRQPAPLLFFLIVLGLSAAACGGRPAPSAPEKPEPAPEAAPPPAAPASPSTGAIDPQAKEELASLQKMVTERMKSKQPARKDTQGAKTNPFTDANLGTETPPPPNLDALFGMKWGDLVAAGMEPQVAKLPPGAAMYRRPADRHELGTAKLEAVYYIYEQGQLSGLSIQVAATERDRLALELEKAWGASAPGPNDSLRWTTPTLMAVLRRLQPPNDASFSLNVFRLEPIVP